MCLLIKEIFHTMLNSYFNQYYRNRDREKYRRYATSFLNRRLTYHYEESHSATRLHRNLEDVEYVTDDATEPMDTDSSTHFEDDSQMVEDENQIVEDENQIVEEESQIRGNKNLTPSQRLAKWVNDTHTTVKATNDLLDILRECYDSTLPARYRSPMQTPRNTQDLIGNVDGGQYLHVGLRKCLQSFFVKHRIEGNVLNIDLSIDGVPIKDSGYSLWPILINVVGFEPVLLVGTFYGAEKPGNINEYMNEFVDEYLMVNNAGLSFRDKIYRLKIRCCVCDAVARKFFLRIKGHTGYSSCHKCKIKGERHGGTTSFLGTNHPPRTDEEFRQKLDIEHHHCREPLIIERITDLG